MRGTKEMPKIKVDTVCVGPVETNCYLVENEETSELLIIDPGDEAARIILAIGDRRPAAVLLTHGHFDHIGAADELCARYMIPLYMHEYDIPKLTDPALNESVTFGARVTVHTPAKALHDGDELNLGGMALRVLHTPGHSRGSCCYLLGDECVFCGDTLFDGGYGRTDFADGDFAALRESLRKLLHLSPARIAYPGHGASTRAGRDGEGGRR